MTLPDVTDKIGGLTDITRLPAQLEEQLAGAAGRRERKIADSALGLAVGCIGLAILGFAGYLLLLPIRAKEPLTTVYLIVVGVVAALGLAFCIAGALIADKETVWPVVRGMFALLGETLRFWRAKS